MKRILLSGGVILSALAVVAGATYAAWTASGSVEGNTVSAATISVNVDTESEAIVGLHKPINAEGLIPGDETGEHGVEITNTSSVPVSLWLYADDLAGSGGICASLEFKLVRVFPGNEEVEVFAGKPLLDVNGPENRVLVEDEMEVDEVVRVYQTLKLVEDAPNSAQGQTCEWTEVFQVETI